MIPRLVGMIHLDPLPGAPGFGGSIDRVIDRALRDASILSDLEYSGLMVENFGDAPFFPDDVPPATVAAMTRVVGEIRSVTSLPVGVNVLRNDGLAAVAVAAATEASFVRINVLSGVMYTDQGMITGRAAEIAQARAALAPDLQVLADVFVKHAVPPPGATIEQAAIDTWERAGAHALVLSGAGTGRSVDLAAAASVRRAVPEASLVVGSGATAASLPALSEIFDAAIVGSSIKKNGLARLPIDQPAAAAVAEAARAIGWI